MEGPHQRIRYVIQSGPMMCGTKRKFEEFEIVESYSEQRQSILNISMFKLNRSPSGKQSLRRCVLINNTLKHIETELKKEGVKVYPTAKASLLPTLQHSGSELLDMDKLPEGGCHKTTDSLLGGGKKIDELNVFSQKGLKTASTEYGSTSPCEAMELDSQNVPPVVSALPFEGPVSSGVVQVPSFTSLFDLDIGTSSNVLPSDSLTSFSGSDNPSTAEQCHPSDTDLFSDIDVSMFDFDVSPALSLSQTMKLTPLNAEDLVHSLSSSAYGLAESFSVGSLSCKNEVLSDDLDNIMQILVGI